VTTISLGQTLTGSFTSGTPRLGNGAYYYEYDLPTNLTSFSEITIALDPGNTSTATNNPGDTRIELINATTGATLASNLAYGNAGSSFYLGLIDKTVAPGVSYKLRVSNTNLSNGNFSLSLTDRGQATSIVSRGLLNFNGTNDFQIGTLTAAGRYFPLASTYTGIADVALSPSGLLYGISPSTGTFLADSLYVIDPSIPQSPSGSTASNLLDTSGNILLQSLRSLAFAGNQLYAIGTSATGAGSLYQIDINTKVATSIASLPLGFNNSGDLVYDAPNNRFLASSADTGMSDALWQIPLANPAGATKLGQIGFLNVRGLAVENGQITGYTPATGANSGTNKIIINSSTGAGTFSQNLPNFGDISGAATIVPLTTPIRNDFNGDRRTDILWRNNDRTIAQWQMNGSTVTPSIVGSVPAGWSIRGTGDFSGEGRADLLLSNTNGAVATWEMNGSTISQTNTLSSTLSAGWSLAGTGDFGGDGKAEILLRNTDGRVATWQVNGSTVTKASIIGTASADWGVAGTADFNGDGKADILLSKADGTVVLWQMNGAAVVNARTVGTLGAGWSLAGTGDFNGDSKADILLRNTSGDIAQWQMNGATVTQGLSVGTATNDWQITGTGDFNGDGNADILWRNTDGRAATWQLNGASVISGGLTSAQADSTWNIVAPIG
jgi:FG-GAP-like repeat